jgi:hypothetical protein
MSSDFACTQKVQESVEKRTTWLGTSTSIGGCFSGQGGGCFSGQSALLVE